ncbi:hypothetical protein GGF37_004750 [Kickxella alabastrina]|nr:hypothetical protein GGF37_004750 [Kickxella alabastrina]
MHYDIKALCIKLETAAADNSNLYAQNEKLRAEIAAATTTAEDLYVAKVNATILMEKLNKADLESQKKIDMYYKQRSIAYTHTTMVENKCRRPEAKLRPIQAKVAAANDIADTLCKQLEDARIELGEFAGINAQLAKVEADNTRSQMRTSQPERRISRVVKANKSLEDELADFSSKISRILAEHNGWDRSSATIVIPLKRMLSKANQQLHSNNLCKRGLRNQNIITQRSDERTQVLVD